MIEFSRRLVDVGDGQLEVYRGGSGHLLVGGSQPHSPRPESVAWYAERAQVVYVMPRGHGQSSHVRDATDMQLETIAADLETVRQRLRLGRWVLEGYSGGSQLALTYAFRYPDALAGLIVGFSAANIGTGALEDPRSLISPLHPAYHAALREAGLHPQASAVPEAPRWVQLRNDLWALVQGQRPLFMMPREQLTLPMQAHFEEIVHFDVSSRLHDIGVPTLVVCGRQDCIAPLELCAAIQDGIPGAELLVLDHTAHGLESADAADVGVFRMRVRQFLAHVEGQQIL